MGYKRILIAVDDSPYSMQAAEEGLNLAVELCAYVLILHVVDSINTIGQIGSGILPQEQEKDEMKKSMRLMQVLMKKQPSNINIETIIKEGNPSEIIVEIAQKEKADLIVIGRHGLGSFKHLFFGGVVDEVVKLTKCPVMLVPYKT